VSLKTWVHTAVAAVRPVDPQFTTVMAGGARRAPDGSDGFAGQQEDRAGDKRARAGRARVRGHIAGAAISAALALAWLGLSWWHPAVTYHFGPPLASAAWPIALRAQLRHRATATGTVTAVAGGLLVAVTALIGAVAAHLLQGPTLLGQGNVPAEEMILTACAGAWGWRVAARRRPAWFLPAELPPP
jgi:hypothetical protein